MEVTRSTRFGGSSISPHSAIALNSNSCRTSLVSGVSSSKSYMVKFGSVYADRADRRRIICTTGRLELFMSCNNTNVYHICTSHTRTTILNDFYLREQSQTALKWVRADVTQAALKSLCVVDHVERRVHKEREHLPNALVDEILQVPLDVYPSQIQNNLLNK